MKSPFVPRTIWFISILLASPLVVSSATPKLPGVGAAMQSAVEARDLSGAVTVVVTKDKVLHCEATGQANLARNEPMRADVGNSDGSEFRRAFQQAAADALPRRSSPTVPLQNRPRDPATPSDSMNAVRDLPADHSATSRNASSIAVPEHVQPLYGVFEACELSHLGGWAIELGRGTTPGPLMGTSAFSTCLSPSTVNPSTSGSHSRPYTWNSWAGL